MDLSKVSFNQDFSPSLRGIPKIYRDVARGMEKQFVEFMIEQMHRTISPAKPLSLGMNYYRGKLNSERAHLLTRHRGGLGLQKFILDQIYPQEKRGQNEKMNRRKVNGQY